jgi:cytidyltransferase-like protein
MAMRIFCDGVFDLLHEGHLKHFIYLKKLYPEVYLIVGIMNDKDASEYKRQPYQSETTRRDMVAACRYVDEILLEYSPVMTADFIADYCLDYVAHAFADSTDIGKQLHFFAEPILQNKFIAVPYTHGISTTEITHDIHKSDWKRIWTVKGTENIGLKELSGYENTEFDRDIAIDNIICELGIKSTDKVLEVGCGAGYMAEALAAHCDYYGIDYSRTLVNAHHKFMPTNKILCGEANVLPYKTGYFDKIICNGVFEYFPSKEYAGDVIREMQRVSTSIYILNIRHTSRVDRESKHKYEGVFQHIIYNRDDTIFADFKELSATFETDKRFSMKY